MKNFYFRCILGLVFTTNIFGQENIERKGEISYLSRYTLPILPGFSVDFFMEPTPEFPKNQSGKAPEQKPATADKAKVFITPYVNVPIGGVDITDENGDWLKLENLNAENAKKAKVIIDIKVQGPPIEDTSWAKKMIAIAKNIDPKPPLRVYFTGGKYIEFGAKSPINNSPGLMPGYGNPYDPSASVFDNNKNDAVYQWYLDSYSFELMAVRNLVVEVSCMGKRFPATTFGNPSAFIQLNSTFSLVVEPGDVAMIKAFRKGKFQITASYLTSLSNAEIGTVVENVSGYTAFVFSEFKKELQQRTNSGSSFFIFKNSSTRISKWLSEDLSKNSERYSSYSKTVFQRNIKSERILNMMDDFAWPETTRDRARQDHLDAAKAARAEGKIELADAHDDYASALLAAGASKAPAVDPLKAASALVQKDFLAFLASGVAIEDSRNSGSLTYRRIRSGSFSDDDLRQFNAIFLTSTESESLVTIADFPFQSDISEKRDKSEKLGRDDLVKIVKDSKNVMSAGPWFFEVAHFLDDE